MKHNLLGVILFLIFATISNATLIVHLQAPYRSTPGEENFIYHVLGSAGGSYNASYGETSTTIMASEGNGWFVYIWDKNVSDFQDWQSFNIAATPDSSDQNYNNNNLVKWSEFGEQKMSALFGSDTEIWIYTDSTDFTFTKSYIAPGSKLVWFKSPWGNHALPQMVFGKDTILMRFVTDDVATCGWFYGSISPDVLAKNSAAETVLFMRNRTPYMSWPEAAKDLKAYLAATDSIFIDGTVSAFSPSYSMGTTGACFDSTRTLHVYHPWRANTTYKDSAMFLSVGNNILNNPTRMEADEYARWWLYNFDNKTVNSSNWSSSGARVEFYRKQSEWPTIYFFGNADSLRPMISEWFPTGVYETWIYTKDNGAVDVLFSPLEPKYVRVKSPWENMSPMMILPNDTIKMGPYSSDSSLCGWYQGIVYKHTDDWNMYLRQAFGMTYADARGQKEDNTDLVTFDLSEMILKKDTVYVMPTPTLTSPLKMYDEFPNSTGTCPQLVLNVRIVDWAGEGILLPGATSSEQTDFSQDVDFGGIYNGNDYTTVTYLDSNGVEQTNSKCGGLVQGMVKNFLITDTIMVANSEGGFTPLYYKIPTRVDSLDYPWGLCSAAHEIERWFIPDTVKTATGDYIAATCYQIPMTLDEEGFWLVDISEDSPNGGFFPLDSFEFLDDEKTVRNPKFDSTCIQGSCHNFSFAMKVSAQFQYVKGQYFEFRGDDDVWVFINDRLVVDIGGCHSPMEDGVYLDTIGQNDPTQKLIEGETYSFYIFFSERNATGSNFKMRTSINLQTEKTYYWEEHVGENGVSSINLLQRMVDKNQSCDEGSVAQAKVMGAASFFALKYPDGSTENLENGKSYYGGITISEDGSSFTLDTAGISMAHERGDGLGAGNYTLEFCKEDGSECDTYTFVIYVPQPTIAFADSLGNIIDPDSTRLGVYSNVMYPVYVKVLYRGNNCTSETCLSEITMKSSDTLLSFYNANMELAETVKLEKTVVGDDTLGMVMFYVMSNGPVDSASFHVYGVDETIANELVWKNISLQKAPVPQLSLAEMFDKDGDGVGDSLSVVYDDKVKNDEKWMLDSIAWVFGDSVRHVISAADPNLKNEIDSVLSFTADSLYEVCFTGASGKVYTGTLISYFRYFSKNDTTGLVDTLSLSPSGALADRVPPQVSRVVATPYEDGSMVILSVYLTESLDSASRYMDNLFELKVFFDGRDRSADLNMINMSSVADGSVIKLMYRMSSSAEVVPAVGDSIRLTPGYAVDLSGNMAHENNRWVRIEGEQVLRIDLVKLVGISGENIDKKANALEAHVMSAEKSLDDMQEEIGLPGFCIRYDMSELLLGDSTDLAPEDVEIVWENDVFTSLGAYVNHGSGTVSCADDMFGGDCRNFRGYVYVSWNGTSSNKRLMGTGAYIYKYKVDVRSRKESVHHKDATTTIGIKRLK